MIRRFVADDRTVILHILEDQSRSAKTIATDRSRILEKMRVNSPAALAAYIVRNRFVD